MNKENELDYLVAIYGIFYFTLKDYELIEPESAIPYKLKGQRNNQKNNDSIAVYKWLSERIRGLSPSELQTRAKKFNEIVRSLEDNFFLNQYLMGIFMLEYYLINEASGLDANLILPKVNRLIKEMRKGIIKANVEKDGDEIILDSSQGASNIWRLFNGQAQLTKKVREARLRMWREATRKRKKPIMEKYNLKEKK